MERQPDYFFVANFSLTFLIKPCCITFSRSRCPLGDQEQIRLLQLDKSGIHVSEYLCDLPPREVLEQKLKVCDAGCTGTTGGPGSEVVRGGRENSGKTPHLDPCTGMGHHLIPNKPVKCSFCQSDEGCFLREGNGVHAHKEYRLNGVFSPSGRFAGILAVQFSGLPAAPFFRWGVGGSKGKEPPFSRSIIPARDYVRDALFADPLLRRRQGVQGDEQGNIFLHYLSRLPDFCSLHFFGSYFGP